MKTNFFTERNTAHNYLLDKYQVNKVGKITDCGCFKVNDKKVVLLPWRVE
jgi:hypothetical protein